MHKELQFLYASGRLLAYHFKIHFEYCCVACSDEEHDVRVRRFKSLWRGAADHYEEKWKNEWMKKYLKTQPGVFLLFQFVVIIYKLDSKKVRKEIKKHSAERVRGALLEFLEPILTDCEFFVYNQRTFGNESFHGLCNRYYEKGSAVSFPIFVMKRQFAYLDWNEQMRKKAQGQEDAELQDWQIQLLNLLRIALLG